MWRVLAAAMCLASPAAAAPDPLAPLRTLQAQDSRVMTVAHRLATRGTSFCPDTIVRLSGIRVHVASQYGGRSRSDAVAAFGLGDYPAVLATASRAGADVSVGDWVLAVGDTDLRDAEGRTGYALVEAFEAALARDMARGGAQVIVRGRNGERRVTVRGQPGCASTVELLPSRKFNASADGRMVQITTAVLDMTRDDAELAFVIAHEMAHNILGHRARLERDGRSARAIRATEIEADRLAILLMKSAGYDPHAAARFWARFGKRTGAGIFSDGTHMRTKARVALLEEEAAKLTRQPPQLAQ